MKHKNGDMKCRDCRFMQSGRCHRYPPSHGFNASHYLDWDFPLIMPDWWCGEFDLRYLGNATPEDGSVK